MIHTILYYVLSCAATINMFMTADVNLTSISSISGLTPITVNFLLSTIPANVSKVYFDYGDGTTENVSWFLSSAATSAVSAWPVSADVGNVKNYITTKTFTRDSIYDKRIYTVNLSVYDTISFTPTAYEINVGPIQINQISSTNFSNLRIIKTKYINKNKMMMIFEDQTSGRVYPVFTDPNFDTSLAIEDLTSVYLTLSSGDVELTLDDDETYLVLD